MLRSYSNKRTWNTAWCETLNGLCLGCKARQEHPCWSSQDVSPARSSRSYNTHTTWELYSWLAAWCQAKTPRHHAEICFPSALRTISTFNARNMTIERCLECTGKSFREGTICCRKGLDEYHHTFSITIHSVSSYSQYCRGGMHPRDDLHSVMECQG